MRATIVRPDNVVLVDGEARPIDCSSVDPEISVVQWLGETGWIEYWNPPGTVTFRANEAIDSIEPWQDLIDAWYDWTPPPPIDDPTMR